MTSTFSVSSSNPFSLFSSFEGLSTPRLIEDTTTPPPLARELAHFIETASSRAQLQNRLRNLSRIILQSVPPGWAPIQVGSSTPSRSRKPLSSTDTPSRSQIFHPTPFIFPTTTPRRAAVAERTKPLSPFPLGAVRGNSVQNDSQVPDDTETRASTPDSVDEVPHQPYDRETSEVYPRKRKRVSRGRGGSPEGPNTEIRRTPETNVDVVMERASSFFLAHNSVIVNKEFATRAIKQAVHGIIPSYNRTYTIVAEVENLTRLFILFSKTFGREGSIQVQQFL